MNGTHRLAQVPPGVQCFVGEEARRRRRIEEAVVSVFEGWDYEEIIPPLFDYADVFAGEALAPKTYSFVGARRQRARAAARLHEPARQDRGGAAARPPGADAPLLLGRGRALRAREGGPPERAATRWASSTWAATRARPTPRCSRSPPSASSGSGRGASCWPSATWASSAASSRRPGSTRERARGAARARRVEGPGGRAPGARRGRACSRRTAAALERLTALGRRARGPRRGGARVRLLRAGGGGARGAARGRRRALRAAGLGRPPGRGPRRGARPRLLHRPRLPRLRARPRLRGGRRRPLRHARSRASAARCPPSASCWASTAWRCCSSGRAGSRPPPRAAPTPVRGARPRRGARRRRAASARAGARVRFGNGGAAVSLTVALSKGKLLAGSEALFRRAGLPFPNGEGRKLVVAGGRPALPVRQGHGRADLRRVRRRRLRHRRARRAARDGRRRARAARPRLRPLPARGGEPGGLAASRPTARPRPASRASTRRWPPRTSSAAASRSRW